MANKRISELPGAVTLDGSEVVPVVQGGATRQTTAGALTAAIPPGTFVKATGGGREKVVTISSAGSAATLNLANGNVFEVFNPVAGGTCTLTLAGATAGDECGCSVRVHQRASGNSGLAFGGGTIVAMNEGGLPGPVQKPNGVATYSLTTSDGGVTWYAYKTGDSETSEPPEVPGAPTGAVATRGNTQASIAFTPPADDGGSTITSYTVTSTPGSFTASGASSPIVVTGLTNGTSYTFTVHATNAIGNSAESTPSSAVTPASTPGAPTIGTASFGDTTTTINWSAPGSNGGSAITGYLAKLYRTSDNVEVGSQSVGVVTTYQFTGLTNGTGVYGKVAAINAVGTGSQSGASNSVTPASGPTVPGAPTIGTATADDEEATANWSAPGSNGGSAITGYEVKTYLDSDDSLIDTDTVGVVLTDTVTGLTNGAGVYFKVAAINAVGTGPQSAASNTVTPSEPVTPATLNTKLWFKASALAFADGAAITAAADQSASGNNLVAPGTAEPIMKTGILDGKAVARYNGTNRNLHTAGLISSAVNDFAVFAVASCADASVARRLSQNSGGVWLCPSGIFVAGKVGLFLPGVLDVPTALNTPSGFAIYAFRRLAGTLQLFVNGGAAIATTATAPPAQSGATYLGGSSDYYNGDLAEWFQVDQSPTDAIMNGLGAYVVSEYPSQTWTPI